MSFNIKVEGGKTVRLPTKGKYCDRDIVVTAEGGAEDLNDVLTEQEALIAELQAVLRRKVASVVNPVIEPLEVTGNGTYAAPDGVDGYSPVTVNVASDTESNIEHLTAYELEDLIRWYNIGWYDSLSMALDDIKNGTIGMNALADSTGATVGVYEDDGIPCIVLVEDCTIGEQITVEDIYINLNGCVLTSTDSIAVEASGNFTIDGRAKGSKIIAGRTAVNVVGSECTIIGGAYETKPLGTGVDASPDGVLVVAADAKLNLSHASITSADNNGGTICGIWAKGNSIINASDCNFEIASKRGFNVCGVYGDGNGEATFTNCRIVADADHTANEAGTNYATMSRAIHYTGTLYLYNCYVYGTHSGVTPQGDITIVGGTYEGYSHGGIYLYCGNNGVNKTAHIYDATLKECALHDGYIDDGVAGTNYAGIYSAGSNTTFYIDNCNLYATSQVIVMKGTNNTLHISRTHINHTYWRTAIRIDSSTHKVYIGANCNFAKDDTDRASVCTETDEVYRPFVENVQIPDGYIKPSGELEVTENGTHDVTAYASVNVNVEASGGDPKALLDATLNNTLTAIDSSVTSIVAYACRGLSKLKTVNLPNATSIGTYAFYGCTALTGVSAPNVTTLSGYTFRGCSRLTSIDLPELTTCADNDFYGTAVPTLYLPKLTNCDTYTFSTMKTSKVILPAMKTIASNAFRGASIVTVDLASCTNIAANGFQQCSSFAHLILRSDSVCALANTSAFTSTLIAKGTGYVYVPAALIETYKTATNWSTFAAQFRAIEDYSEIAGG